MIVVDTNIISYLYIAGEVSEQVEVLLTEDSHWVAPILWKSEFRSVMSKYLRKGYLTIENVLLIIDQAEKLMSDNEYDISSIQVLQLVNASNCSSYDCEFVALAQYLDIPLITTDKKILQSFPGIAKSIDQYIN